LTAKLLLQFLDATLSVTDQSQGSVMEEFAEDIHEVVVSLLEGILLYIQKECSYSGGSEERVLLSELVFKSLTVVEWFLNFKGPKVNVSDIMKKDSTCIR
jgi:hypothetical protein